MSQIVVTKDDTGKLVGFGEKHAKAYAKFRRMIEALEPGEMFTLDVWFPRSGKFHRLHFGMLAAVFNAQEQFSDFEQFRAWTQVGAGHVEFVPGPKGRMVALPKSISWAKLDDAEFSDHHDRVRDFLRSEHATAFLWGHLERSRQAQMIDELLREFEVTG